MAAYSIGFDNATRRPWHKLASATIGTDAPGGTLAVQLRIVDGGNGMSKAEIERAVLRLLDLMRETQGPHF